MLHRKRKGGAERGYDEGRKTPLGGGPGQSFRQAKMRLAPLLDAGQGAELASLMLADVLASLQHLHQLSGILVVTRDAKAKDIGDAYGARIVDDPVEDGPNAAIRLALPVLRAIAASRMILVPSDVPGLEPEQLRPVIEAFTRPSVALVAAAPDGGTNLLGCAPMNIVVPSFGANSSRDTCMRRRSRE